MTPIRIDIPAARPRLLPQQAYDAADIVIEALREAGLDPRKAYQVPLVQALVIDWRDGNSSRAQFINGCRNIGILNPSVLAKGGAE